MPRTRKILGVQNGVGGSDGGVMMGIARRRHGQAADLRIFEGIAIVAAQGGGGVENFERIDRQLFEGRETDPGAKQIIGMWRNGEPAALVNEIADFARRPAFEIGKRSADAEQMAFRRRDFDAGDDEKIVHRQAVLAHQPFLEEVGDAVVGVVIGEGETVQALSPWPTRCSPPGWRRRRPKRTNACAGRS